MVSNTTREMVEVRGRFHRSVRLVRDWETRDDFGGYLLTPTVRGIATRMLEGLSEQGGTRAWSITGPYGSGKSAFALFLADLLGRTAPQHPGGQRLREEFELDHSPFLPVLVVGQRSAVKPAILTALAESLEPVDASLAQEARAASCAEGVSDGTVTALFERAGDAARRAGLGGMLIVFDEFGKFLEYAALHPETEDLFVMQGLAEIVARSATPILLVTVLHTAFAEYLSASADDSQQAEWRKVQGRFTEVTFQEPPEQLLKLIGSAIVRHMPEELEAAYLNMVGCAAQSPALEEARRRFSLDELLPACVPLHPVTALLLSPLFRSKLAQNERSLFAFLTGHEPSGFTEFVSTRDWRAEESLHFYRVDRLYDYVNAALGAGVYRGDLGRRWAEVEHALSRVKSDAPRGARAIVKVVGLLGMYGRPVGLRASKETILLAVDDQEEAIGALEYLASASILVYRKHESAYALWEGSDVDLDARFEEALEQVGRGGLAERLKRAVSLRSLVARAHYIGTGTLRYFEVDIVDGTSTVLERTSLEDATPADGRLVYVLAPEQKDRAALVHAACALTRDVEAAGSLRIFAFPLPMAGLEEALREVEAWRWVQGNVRALEGDPVARQELRARRRHSQERLEDIAGKVLGLLGHRFDPSASEWVQGGALRVLDTAREFSSWLSELCRDVYSRTPSLQNELLNRTQLSSAAAAARRNLIKRMFSHEGEERLGIGGTPPEVSMYESLLVGGNFYRLRGGELGFGEPGEEWGPVWEATEAFLESTHAGRRPLEELYELWKRPPYGLREGPLPVLLCAVVLAHRDEVALYENNVYVTGVGIEVFERLMRLPGTFEIQRFALSGYGRQALEAAGAVVGALGGAQDASTGSLRLLQVVEPLVVSVARLPTYARYTKRVEPPQAVGLREVLIRASDPYALLFEEMPEVLGVSLDSPEGVSKFGELLHDCLLGLQRAYPRLLDKVEEQLREAFDLHGSSEEVRERLWARAEPLVGFAADRTLALFVREANRNDERDWREVLARVVNDGTPTSHWRDADLVTFQLRLQEVASDFVRLEELVSEKRRTGAEQILRIHPGEGQRAGTRGTP